MSAYTKKWNSNSKNNTKKRPYKKKKEYVKNREDEFPSLLSTNTQSITSNKFSVLEWRKTEITKTNDEFSIYDKAKKGASLFNSYPLFSNSPSFPLFQ